MPRAENAQKYHFLMRKLTSVSRRNAVAPVRAITIAEREVTPEIDPVGTHLGTGPGIGLNDDGETVAVEVAADPATDEGECLQQFSVELPYFRFKLGPALDHDLAALKI